MINSNNNILKVNTYSGYRADERPISLVSGNKTIYFRELIDKWYGEDYVYFKLLGEDGYYYILKHYFEQDIWEVTGFLKKG